MITILNWILGSVQEEKELDINGHLLFTRQFVPVFAKTKKKWHLFCNVSFIYFSHFRDENTLYSRATLLELD